MFWKKKRRVFMRFDPKEDITTYELALCVKFFIEHRHGFYKAKDGMRVIFELGPKVNRHITVIEEWTWKS